jgi:deoxyribonuclease V
VRRVAGVDISVDRPGGRATGAVVVLSYPELAVIEVAVARAPLTFPYVPGLLSFRETPVLREAFRRLAGPIDLLLVDGQGLAHPRRFGLACHLGLLLDAPAIGVAKSRLLGEHGPVGEEAGSRADLRDGAEVIGSVLRTRTGVRPLYVSIGHRVSLRQAEAWVLRCCRGYRLPEPTRLAHQAAARRLPQIPRSVVQ